jgi:hypothetical protein
VFSSHNSAVTQQSLVTHHQVRHTDFVTLILEVQVQVVTPVLVYPNRVGIQRRKKEKKREKGRKKGRIS